MKTVANNDASQPSVRLGMKLNETKLESEFPRKHNTNADSSHCLKY
jgi:hypothetical protein